jgi:hypothetical protein
MEGTPIPSESAPGQPQRMSGKRTNVALAFFGITVPMLLLPGLLLGLVLGFRVRNDPTFPSLQTDRDREPSTSSAYYVDFSVTNLVFLAGLMATISSAIVSLFMALYAYPAMRRLVKKSANDQYAELLTPYQLGLFIAIVKGGLASLWTWFLYSYQWKGRRGRISRELTSAGLFLAVMIALRYVTCLRFSGIRIGYMANAGDEACWSRLQISGSTLPPPLSSSLDLLSRTLLESRIAEVSPPNVHSGTLKMGKTCIASGAQMLSPTCPK